MVCLRRVLENLVEVKLAAMRSQDFLQATMEVCKNMDDFNASTFHVIF